MRRSPPKIRPRETKSFPAMVTKADDEQGIVDAFVSIMGNIDHGDDIIHSGAFAKTISERAGKIRVLDNHNMWSVNDAIARIIEIREVTRRDLPAQLQADVPDATGGLFVSMQFLMNDEQSAGVFKRIKAGVINEYSIGFEIIVSDIENVEIDNTEISVRNIREIKLWEVSPVIFAMNDATTTAAVKSDTPTLEQRDNIPSLRTIGEKSGCLGCKAYGRVTDAIGYCTAHEMGVYATQICDSHIPSIEIPQLQDDFKARALTFLNKLTSEYLESGIWDSDDVTRLTFLQSEVVESMVSLLPDDLLARNYAPPLDEKVDIASDSVDVATDTTLDNQDDKKRRLWRESMALQLRKIRKA